MKKGTQHNYLATHYVKKSNMAIKRKDGCQKNTMSPTSLKYTKFWSN